MKKRKAMAVALYAAMMWGTFGGFEVKAGRRFCNRTGILDIRRTSRTVL